MKIDADRVDDFPCLVCGPVRDVSGRDGKRLIPGQVRCPDRTPPNGIPDVIIGWRISKLVVHKLQYIWIIGNRTEVQGDFVVRPDVSYNRVSLWDSPHSLPIEMIIDLCMHLAKRTS